MLKVGGWVAEGSRDFGGRGACRLCSRFGGGLLSSEGSEEEEERAAELGWRFTGLDGKRGAAGLLGVRDDRFGETPERGVICDGGCGGGKIPAGGFCGVNVLRTVGGGGRGGAAPLLATPAPVKGVAGVAVGPTKVVGGAGVGVGVEGRRGRIGAAAAAAV